MLSVLIAATLLAGPAGTFVDLATKERLVFVDLGQSITYSSRGKNQPLRVTGSSQEWPLTVSFPASNAPYVLSIDEPWDAVRCRNPDGSVQRFLREDSDGVVRRAAPTSLVLLVSPGKPGRGEPVHRGEILALLRAEGAWVQVRTQGRAKNVAGWLKASALRSRQCSVDGWCSEPLPAELMPGLSALSRVFALGEADVWFVGDGVLHWDGAEWSKPKVPVSELLSAAWGPRANLLWAVGSSGTLLRWNGARWTLLPSGTTETLTDVWGSSEKDVWAVGKNATLLHWDGDRWTLAPRDEDLGDLNRLWGFGPEDVWAVGARGALLHWNGKAWRRSSSPVAGTFTDVWGTSSKNVFAVTDSCDLVRWNGTQWALVEVPEGMCFDGWSSIHGSDARTIWLTTSDGMRFWNGADWAMADLSELPNAHASAVRSTAASEWWAVGGGGSNVTVLHLSAVTASPLFVTESPFDQAVRPGMPATFAVKAMGSGPLVYQWRRDRVPIRDANRVTWTVPAATAADDGATFDVVVTDSAGFQRESRTATLITSGLFVEAPSLATPRVGHQATLLGSGQVLVTGGANAQASALAEVELYDPSNKERTALAPLATARRYHTATALESGAVLVVGGQSTTAYLGTAELFEPSSRSFAPTKGALPSPRAFHTATRLDSGRVLVVGGRADGPPPQKGAADEAVLRTAVVFDPAKGLFTEVGSMSLPRWYHTATLLKDGRVLVVGGTSSQREKVTARAEVFDPATGAFSNSGPLTVARSGHSATLLPDGKVLITGGWTDTQPTSSAELFDPATGAFTPTTPLPFPMRDHTATLLPSGKVLIAGCATFSHTYGGIAELFSPSTQTFSATGWLVEGRWAHQATLLPDGKVLLTGGKSPEGASATQELFSEWR